jgi:L-ascorbate metabolism protein UlaG (beta-lactamase superfamily)
LVVTRAGVERLLPLTADLTAELARWIGEWARGASAPTSPRALALWRALVELGAIAAEPASPALAADGLLFAGHANALVASGGARVVLDPYLWPTSPRFPDDYQPVSASELAPTVVLITHSHPDHFAPGSLLRFGADLPIVVPAVERENLLAVDMAARLRELGFREVHELPWHGRADIGGARVTALPFFGEQPTVMEQLHPEVRNQGNTYHVAAGPLRCAFLADAGRDRAGSTAQLMLEAHRALGPVDVLVGGYRAWNLYPAQYLTSSVSRYLLFVPPEQLGVRQQIMNDAHDLVDCGELWGARAIVPYADGGAPWHWEIGLGPRLDQWSEDQDFDPAPDAVLRAARTRSSVHGAGVRSPVPVLLLRPGESLARADGGGFAVRTYERHRWPYPATRPLLRDTVMTVRELIAIARKKVLLRLLAAPEIERLELGVDAADVQRLADGLRRDYGLDSAATMREWMALAGLSADQLSELLYEWASIVKLEEHYEQRIDELADAQIGFGTMREWPRR